jgi:hypothetical protein
VATLVNFTSDPGEGMRFCHAVQGEEPRRQCYYAVGETISMMFADTDARGRACEAAEAGFVAACRRGAELEPAGVEAGGTAAERTHPALQS